MFKIDENLRECGSLPGKASDAAGHLGHRALSLGTPAFLSSQSSWEQLQFLEQAVQAYLLLPLQLF